MKLTDSEITLLQQSIHTLDFAFHDQLLWSKQCAGRTIIASINKKLKQLKKGNQK